MSEHGGHDSGAAVWMETAFTKLLGCRYPLQQAAMVGVAVPELAGGGCAGGGPGDARRVRRRGGGRSDDAGP
jgi:NAD(P)H-dependent flavin oxidoreductase YrpB (nitropropane dioxygenase family)